MGDAGDRQPVVVEPSLLSSLSRDGRSVSLQFVDEGAAAALAELLSRSVVGQAVQEGTAPDAGGVRDGGGGGRGGGREGSGKGGKGKGKRNRVDTESVKLTRDFPPQEMFQRQWMFGHFHEAAKAFGFYEYDAPVLEKQELYKRKAGDAAEELMEQMYTFETREHEEVTLRPEMTPSLARLVLQLGKAAALPLRWYSIPQCWRFESGTRGRRREHFQWNCDIVGDPSVTADAEVIATACTAMQRMSLTAGDVEIRIFSRRVLSALLTVCGVAPPDFIKMDKIEDALHPKLLEDLRETGPVALSDHAISFLCAMRRAKCPEQLLTMAWLMARSRVGVGPPIERPDDCAWDSTRWEDVLQEEVAWTATPTGDDEEVRSQVHQGMDQVKNGVNELNELFALLAEMGFGAWAKFNTTVVRGLAYYTGTVFEGYPKIPDMRAICGGGRYDNLLLTYDPSTQIRSACGFGFGDCVIMEVLKEKEKKLKRQAVQVVPRLPALVDDVVMCDSDPLCARYGASLCTFLRGKGRRVELSARPVIRRAENMEGTGVGRVILMRVGQKFQRATNTWTDVAGPSWTMKDSDGNWCVRERPGFSVRTRERKLEEDYQGDEVYADCENPEFADLAEFLAKLSS